MSFRLPYARRLDAIEQSLARIEANQRSAAIRDAHIIATQEKIMSGLRDAQAAITNLASGVEETLAFITSQVDGLRQAYEASDDQKFEDIATSVNNSVAGLRQGIVNAKAAASAPGMGPVTNTGLPAGAGGNVSGNPQTGGATDGTSATDANSTTTGTTAAGAAADPNAPQNGTTTGQTDPNAPVGTDPNAPVGTDPNAPQPGAVDPNAPQSNDPNAPNYDPNAPYDPNRPKAS